MSFFCSKTASKFNFGTLALITEEMKHISCASENESTEALERVLQTIKHIGLDLLPGIGEPIESIRCFVSHSTILNRCNHSDKDIVLKSKHYWPTDHNELD